MKKIALFLLAIVTLSCSEEQDNAPIIKPSTDEPEVGTSTDKPLKECFGAGLPENFKLGVMLVGTTYLEEQGKQDLVNANFNEMSDGYFMKHVALVKDNGEFNFGTVDNVVRAAKAKGINIFGHALCWHSSQNRTYLTSLIKDKTDEEKKVIVSRALKNFIYGVMEHYSDDIKTWDAINEPLSDNGPDFPLRSDPEETQAANVWGYFVWQDYIGENYGRDVIKYAREAGGDDQLLFVNEYGLEWPWSDQGKCRSFIKLIERWESDGVTRIDGLGTQLHTNYSMNPDTQKQNSAGITKMFELLAATGKLIRISELDIQMLDASGKVVLNDAMTPELHTRLAEYMRFILEQYFTIIPKEQQYGITHGTPFESNDPEAPWRALEPVGIWNYRLMVKPEMFGAYVSALSRE